MQTLPLLGCLSRQDRALARDGYYNGRLDLEFTEVPEQTLKALFKLYVKARTLVFSFSHVEGASTLCFSIPCASLFLVEQGSPRP